jgi:hypothetical protein
MDEFYIGYLPNSPPATARRVRAAVVVLLLASCLLAAGLVIHQASFGPASFEYDHERSFIGVMQSTSLPLIALDDGSSAVLVAPGKYGFVMPGDIRPGTSIAFRGKLIQGQGSKLIEVSSPLQITARGAVPMNEHTTAIDVQGEIVDTKCFGGVMNPGSGKVHRSCAARCLHGGIPPALLTASGELYYLLDSAGVPLSPTWISSHAGEQIRVQGDLVLMAGTRMIRTSVALLASD